MRIENVLQGSEAWLALRAGRITGSRMIDVLALSKPKTALAVVDLTTGEIGDVLGNGVRAAAKAKKLRAAGANVKEIEVKPATPLQARVDYGEQLAFERIAKVPQLTRETVEMKWGKNCEPYARFCYEARAGIQVQQPGFCIHDCEYVGISPDGFVRDDGGIEIKSPYNGRIHIHRWLHGMEDEHMPQVQSAMWVTGRRWWDFVSFDPRVEKDMQLYIQTIPRDDAYIERLIGECAKLDTAVQTLVRECLARPKMYSQAATNMNFDAPQLPAPAMPLTDQGEAR